MSVFSGLVSVFMSNFNMYVYIDYKSVMVMAPRGAVPRATGHFMLPIKSIRPVTKLDPTPSEINWLGSGWLVSAGRF
jgi:hypothetical protein